MSSRSEPLPPPRSGDRNTLQGVAGWLLFFCLTLTVLMPGTTLIATWLGWPAAEVLAAYPGLGQAFWLSNLGEALILAYAIRTGLALWKVAPGALPRARRFLLALAGWRLAAPFLQAGLAQLPPEGTQAMLVAGLQDSLRTLVFVAVWWVYLKRSRRVAATYPA